MMFEIVARMGSAGRRPGPMTFAAIDNAPAPNLLQERVGDLVSRVGLMRAITLLGLSRTPIERLLGGLAVRRANEWVAEAALDRLDAARAARSGSST